MTFQKHNLILGKKALEKLDEFLDGAKLLAVDTETNGLEFYKKTVIGVSIAKDPNQGFYIPLLTWMPDKTFSKTTKVAGKHYPKGNFECVWTQKTYHEDVGPKEYQAPSIVKKYLKKWLEASKTKLLMHNAPFDVLMLKHSLGLDLAHKVFCDTALLKHVVDENTSAGLKPTAILWSEELGFPSDEFANEEQKILGASVLKNGGKFNKSTKHVWRADLKPMAHYACADAFLTFGIYKVGLRKFSEEFEPKHLDWFFQDEVMPLCREVVIPMKEGGIYIDVPHFEKLQKETKQKLLSLEDEIIEGMGSLLDDFTIGSSKEDAVTRKLLVTRIMELEGLDHPVQVSKDGITKKSLSKSVLNKLQNENPHWLWGYLLSEDEIRYSDEKLEKIKNDLYYEVVGRRYQFNIQSDQHLRWLFCDKLGHSRKSLPQTDSATAKNPIPSVKAEVLEEFFKDKYSFVKPLLLYKKLHKLFNTYVEKALTLQYEGKLFVDMKQNGTISGRFSCSGGFNAQTLPQVEELPGKCPECGHKELEIDQEISLLIREISCPNCGEFSKKNVLTPSAIKDGFITPPGHLIGNADFSSLEPRCFAFVSGDKGLKEVYWDDLDLYSKLYCDMLDPEGKYSPDPKADNYLKKAYKQGRNMIKPVALGVPYGALASQTASLLNYYKEYVDQKTGESRSYPDKEKGAEFIKLYLDTYPKLREYMEKQDLKALTEGYVETLVGRRRHFQLAPLVYEALQEADMEVSYFLEGIKRKEMETLAINETLNTTRLKEILKKARINEKDEKGVPRNWGFVKAVFKNELNNAKNFPIQGLAASITNRAMLDMTREFKKQNLSAWVFLTVHDEISIYAKEDEIEESCKILQKTMEDNIYTRMLDVAMIAEPLVCKTLKDSK